MPNPRTMVVVACAGLLSACATGQPAEQDLSHADIAHIANVKSGFGSEFKVTSVGPTGIDRVVQTTVDGKPRTGELYNYIASFGTFLVIVTANPLVLPDKPVAPVNTQRARDLLTAAVGAVRG